MEVPVKLGIEGLSQMARDRFMAIFQATPGKRSRTGLQTPRHWENPEQWREPSREATVLQSCRGARGLTNGVGSPQKSAWNHLSGNQGLCRGQMSAFA